MPGDPEVHLDLQAAFDRCYDAGPYARRVDYTQTPPIPPAVTQDPAASS